MSLLEKLLNLFYPPICPICKKNISAIHTLCNSCWKYIKFITDPLCKKCGKPIEQENFSEFICDSSCYQKNHSYKMSRSAILYNENFSYLIKEFKYHDKIQISKLLTNWLLLAGSNIINECDIIVPVPLHKNKLKIRKYNQAALLAAMLSKKSKKPYFAELLIKVKDTKNQSSLTKMQRMKNLKGAFYIKKGQLKNINEKTVLLIDDVITTGSTTNECSNILLKNGAKKILVLTIAKRLLYE